MDEQTKKDIEPMLRKLSMVNWDRYVNPADGEYWFYGWIQREEYAKCGACVDCELVHENRADFVVLAKVSDWWWYMTSSKRYTAEIGEIVNGAGSEHAPCIRVEDTFKIPNMIKL